MTSTTAGTLPVSTTAGPTEPAYPTRARPLGAALAAAALVLGAAGNTAQAVMTQMIGGRPETIDDMVAVVAESPTLVTAMSVTGAVAIPFMAFGFAAAARLLARRARRTGLAAGSLLVLGMWGFLGLQLIGLVQIRALLDGQAGLAAATWMQGLREDTLLGVLLALPFLAGTVLGMLTLTIGLLVKGGVPRWIPGAWLVFIVLDFTVGAVGPVDPHWLYLLGAVGLAHHVLTDGGRAWKNA